ncbi:MAG: hypothetical protein RL490_2752 [Pseudomonadota bacterium]|jgi:hypothetical protein
MLPCPVCDAVMQPAFTAAVLYRHQAHYDHCSACGYLRARAPHWLDEAYADAIAITDTGLLQRNQVLARQLTALFGLLGTSRDAHFLDFAGGYGVLTRLMRDAGFDFHWSDKYSRNLLATGFEFNPGLAPCRAVTAFEVLEHVEDPRGFVAEALAASGADIMVFSTQTYDGPPPPRDWWYYAFETGQHIGFFRPDTLARLGQSLGLHFQSYRGVHMFSRVPQSRWRFRLAVGRLASLLAFVIRRRRGPLTDSDHRLMIQRLADRADQL